MVWERKGRGGKAADTLKKGAEAAANGIHQVTNFVASHDGRVADGAQAATHRAGQSLDKVGRSVSTTGRHASRALHGQASRAADKLRDTITGPGQASAWRQAAAGLGWYTTKIAVHAAGLTADAVTGVGKAAALTGRMTAWSAPVVGGTVGGVVRGAAEAACNAVDAAALPASRIEAMRTELRSLGQVELARAKSQLQAIESAQARRRKDELLDLLVVGGITLGDALRHPDSVPANIEEAFRLAYPGLTQTESFSDAVSRMSSDELAGLTSGVKGKLFELELVDHLNNGGLPEGFRAALAPSVTQPGWDVQVTNAEGYIDELLQAKASDSASYVKEALERYPNIDVSTTTEVHAQLVAMGLAEQVRDSGISQAVLQAKVDAAAHGGSAFDASDLLPSSLGFAVIALSAFMKKNSTLREKGAAFGTRSAKAGISSVVGNVAMMATQTWWLALLAGVGSNWLAGRGQAKREQYIALRTALECLRKKHLGLLVPAGIRRLRLN